MSDDVTAWIDRHVPNSGKSIGTPSETLTKLADTLRSQIPLMEWTDPIGQNRLNTSMSSVEASPVKTSVTPATVLALTGNDRGSGFRCSDSFASYDPDTSSWRTSQRSWIEDWARFSAESGYDTEWASFPTGRQMGHERERVFIVAHLVREGLPQWSHPHQVRVDAPRIFTGQRFAGFLAGIDSRQVWADRPLLGRGIHGIPQRVDRVRALGNAINPHVCQAIAERIKEAELVGECGTHSTTR